MNPKTALSYSLILYLVVNLVICLSSVEASNETLDIIEQSANSNESNSELSKRSNKLEEDNEDDDEEVDVDGAPPDHSVPYTSHENPEEPSTKPKYNQPGDWAKPAPDHDIPLDFVPTKLYAQVRGTHTIKRVPREEALKNAKTPEEILAAPRLREVVSKLKKNTIYTEEGYEDSAYDHAGHIRDADFHEGFAKKLEGKRTSKKNTKIKPVREKLKTKKEESNGDFKEYNDDYRDHVEQSTRIENTKPLKRSSKKAKEEYKKIKNHWQDDVNPKKVTENEIEQLEKDLEKEYAESERNTEDEVPDNLKYTNSDNDDEADESNAEQSSSDEQEYGERLRDKNSGESTEILSETSTDQVGENVFSATSSAKDEENQFSGSSPLNQTEFQTETVSPTGYAVYETTRSSDGLPTDSPTPNYGQIFWNYFKQLNDTQKPTEISTPSNVETTSIGNVKPTSEKLTSIPNVDSVLTTTRDFDSSSFISPRTDSSEHSFASNVESPVHARAASLYDSWKREEREADSEESPEIGSLEGPANLYPIGYEETTTLEDEASNSDGTTTAAVPKKLSYKVLIRAKDKATTMKVPRHRGILKEPKETKSFVQAARPLDPKMLKYVKNQLSPRDINDIAVKHHDFTVIKPPPRAVTYGDFLPDTYTSHLHPSVTHESGQLGEEIHAERDRYAVLSSLNDKRFSNIFNRPPESPQLYNRHGHHLPMGHKRNHLYPNLPSTKLLPPALIGRSNYADYSNIRRVEKALPARRFEQNQPLDSWSGLVQLYRSIDRGIFGRRKRRSLSKENIEELMHRSNWKLKRENLGALKEVEVKNIQQTKPKVGTKRDHEDLLNQSPNIVEKEINAEIDSRFNNKEEGDDEKEETDSTENERGKVDVEVPEIDISEIIESDQNDSKVFVETIRAKKLDVDKYPFYDNSKIPQSSALKYITNPDQVPRKTLGGTEFYDSRDKYLECDEVEPNLEKVLPEEEEPKSDRDPRGDEPRLSGLGDKLDCLRAKYFDENPLDNPLFLEQQIDDPRAPEEFDAAKFSSKIFGIPDENQQQSKIVPRVSRKPEYDLKISGSNKNQMTQEDERSNRLVYNKNPKRDKEQSTRNHESRRKGRRKEKKNGTKEEGTKTSHNRLILPYERQVYEDVMGTIKNLAGMHQDFAEPPSTPLLKPNVNYPPNLRDNNWNFPVVQITERPRTYFIQGSLSSHAPAAHHPVHRYRVIPYRTNKVSYRTKLRTEIPAAAGDGVKVGYFKTVRVHKRSIDDGRKEQDTVQWRNVALRDTNDSSNSTNFKKGLQATGKNETPTSSDRVVYSIYDRIRYSKPRGKYGRNGKFTNLETAGTDDTRRREPRYNKFEHKKGISTSTNDSLNANRELVGEASGTIVNDTQDRTTGRQDFHHEPGEDYKIQFSTIRDTKAKLSRRRNDDTEEDYDEEKDSRETPKKNYYHVHENVEDDVTTVSSLIGELTMSPEFFNLQEFLESDPPGYSEAFAESSASLENTSGYKLAKNEEELDDGPDAEDEKESTKSHDRAKTKRNEVRKHKKQKEQSERKRPSKSYADEESLPRSEEDGSDVPVNSETYKKTEDNEDDENSQDAEKEFINFSSRPYLSIESNEDPKDADVPRKSLPTFNDPSFPKSEENHQSEYSTESDEDGSDENGSKKFTPYKFPWEQDASEGVEESKNSGSSSFEIYEFPWEKRARRIREKKKRKKARKAYDKLFGYSDDSDEDTEENTSNTRLYEKRVYPPWIYDDLEAKKLQQRNISRNGSSLDNIDVGTEYRPITRYSSRYKSKMFDLNDDDDPIDVSGADVSKIRASVIKSIRKATHSKTTKPINISEAVVSINTSTIATTTVVDPDEVSVEPSSTIATRSSTNWETASVSENSTVPAMTTDREATASNLNKLGSKRTSRITLTTTKRPIRFRKRLTSPVNELLKSGSQIKTVTSANTLRNNSKSFSNTPSNTTLNSGIANKIRLRGSSVTNVRPFRRKFPKMTVASKSPGKKNVKDFNKRTTTPKTETIEHRTSFSEESIITKTSYPRLVHDDNKKEENRNSSQSERIKKHSKKLSDLKNERVKKLSILMKRTPDKIYHKEEIDRDGVKGMFLSITPNSGTVDSMEDPDIRGIDNEETKAILKRFEDFDDKEMETDAESLCMHDSYLMANLLRQVPPMANHFTFGKNSPGGNNFSEVEGSENRKFDEDSI